MAYEVVMSYHLHMPSYFLGTFTEYPYLKGECSNTLDDFFRARNYTDLFYLFP